MTDKPDEKQDFTVEQMVKQLQQWLSDLTAKRARMIRERTDHQKKAKALTGEIAEVDKKIAQLNQALTGRKTPAEKPAEAKEE